LNKAVLGTLTAISIWVVGSPQAYAAPLPIAQSSLPDLDDRAEVEAFFDEPCKNPFLRR
jgi:hypothetical protein